MFPSSSLAVWARCPHPTADLAPCWLGTREGEEFPCPRGAGDGKEALALAEQPQKLQQSPAAIACEGVSPSRLGEASAT